MNAARLALAEFACRSRALMVMLVRAPTNHWWWMPSQSKTLSQGLLHVKSRATSAQKASGSFWKRSRSAAQSGTNACCLTISGAGYSSTADLVADSSDSCVPVLMEGSLQSGDSDDQIARLAYAENASDYRTAGFGRRGRDFPVLGGQGSVSANTSRCDSRHPEGGPDEASIVNIDSSISPALPKEFTERKYLRARSHAPARRQKRSQAREVCGSHGTMRRRRQPAHRCPAPRPARGRPGLGPACCPVSHVCRDGVLQHAGGDVPRDADARRPGDEVRP